jgi:hypothetical protein
VYPAAALRIWGLDPRGYKGPKPEQRAKRAALTARLCDATASWLAFADADRASVPTAITSSTRSSARSSLV